MSLQSPAAALGLTVGPEEGRDPPISRADLADLVKATPVAEMDQYVAAGTVWVENRCGPITPGQWVYQVTQSGDGALLVPSGPIDSVDALFDRYNTDHLPGLRREDVNWATGKITVPFMGGVWLVQVTTTRTDNAVSDLKEAALVIAKHLWTIRRGPLAQGAGTIHDQAVNGQIGFGYAIPDRARQLVGDYLVGGFA